MDSSSDSGADIEELSTLTDNKVVENFKLEQHGKSHNDLQQLLQKISKLPKDERINLLSSMAKNTNLKKNYESFMKMSKSEYQRKRLRDKIQERKNKQLEIENNTSSNTDEVSAKTLRNRRKRIKKKLKRKNKSD